MRRSGRRPSASWTPALSNSSATSTRRDVPRRIACCPMEARPTLVGAARLEPRESRWLASPWLASYGLGRGGGQVEQLACAAPVPIAFFDFDETLIVGNSGTLWVRRELRSGHISRLQALRAASWMVRYRLGFASMEEALRTAIRSLAGTKEETLRERTREFYEEEVRQLYRTGAREAVGQHRADGDACVLLTASSLYLSELVSADLALDAVLCNRFQVRDGLHTGESEGELCFGAGKLRYAELYARQHGVSLAECTFYTDSY